MPNEPNKPVAQAAGGLGINESAPPARASKYNRPVGPAKAGRADSYPYDEVKRLTKEVAQLRNPLKRAAARFAKERLSTARMREAGQRRGGCRGVRVDKATRQRPPCPCGAPIYGRFPKRTPRLAPAQANGP